MWQWLVEKFTAASKTYSNATHFTATRTVLPMEDRQQTSDSLTHTAACSDTQLTAGKSGGSLAHRKLQTFKSTIQEISKTAIRNMKDHNRTLYCAVITVGKGK
jgi:hypothetical protein